MSLIEGYRENVRTITVKDQIFLSFLWVLNGAKCPKNQGFWSSSPKSGFQGIEPAKSGPAQAKSQLFAVKAELYGLDRGAVRLHDYLNNHSGFT